MNYARITRAHYAPEQIVSHDLAKIMDTSDEWISRDLFGLPSDLATKVAEQLLGKGSTVC